MIYGCVVQLSVFTKYFFGPPPFIFLLLGGLYAFSSLVIRYLFRFLYVVKFSFKIFIKVRLQAVQ
jgi:hypothetical protein